MVGCRRIASAERMTKACQGQRIHRWMSGRSRQDGRKTAPAESYVARGERPPRLRSAHSGPEHAARRTFPLRPTATGRNMPAAPQSSRRTNRGVIRGRARSGGYDAARSADGTRATPVRILSCVTIFVVRESVSSTSRLVFCNLQDGFYPSVNIATTVK